MSVSRITPKQIVQAGAVLYDALKWNGSNWAPDAGPINVQIAVTDPQGDVIVTGDGKAYFRVPLLLNGMKLTSCAAAITTVSTSGIVTVQIANATAAVDILTTKLTIDQGETDTLTAAIPAVINASNNTVSTGNMIRIDVDVAGTNAKGLIVDMTFTT